MTEDSKLIPMSEGIKILYKETIDNVIFLKRQQWTITNYAMLTYGAIVTIGKAANHVESTLLTIIAALTWAYSTFCMAHTQTTMTKYRRRLAYIYLKYFSSDELKDLKLWSAPPTFNYTPAFFWGLVVVDAIAMSATIYLLWRITPSGAVF